jgi:hypothetical protein
MRWRRSKSLELQKRVRLVIPVPVGQEVAAGVMQQEERHDEKENESNSSHQDSHQEVGLAAFVLRIALAGSWIRHNSLDAADRKRAVSHLTASAGRGKDAAGPDGGP